MPVPGNKRNTLGLADSGYLGQAGAELMHEAKIEEGLCVAELAGGLVEHSRARPVALCAAAVPVAVPQLQQCVHIALPPPAQILLVSHPTLPRPATLLCREITLRKTQDMERRAPMNGCSSRLIPSIQPVGSIAPLAFDGRKRANASVNCSWDDSLCSDNTK